jgi:hypothetical protein
MTLPFFGSGIVELPPEGFKRAKNSRKMQMVFFVHEGKVLVTVGPPAVEQNGRGVSGGEAETNEFAISKGGVWVVPRGMFLLFFPFFSFPSPITSHCIAFQPHDRRSARAQKSHTTPPIVDAGFLHRPRSEKSGQQHLPAHLSNLDSRKLERTPRSEAVCATSRRNNLSIAPKHRTSLRIVAPTPGSPAPRHRTSIHPLQNPRKNFLRMGCYIADASTRFVFGRTTLARHVLHGIWGWLGWLLCDFACKRSLRGGSRVALACFCYCLGRFWLFFFLEYIADFDSITGNNYSISNESRTKNARIFFAQGCEMVPEMVSQSAAE